MRREKNTFILLVIVLMLVGCMWNIKKANDEKVFRTQYAENNNISENYNDIYININETSMFEEKVADAISTEDNSFSDVEYGMYSDVSPEITDFVIDSDWFEIRFINNYQALVSYDEKHGRLQIHLPGCRNNDFGLPFICKNEYFDEIVVAGSEEGIDVMAYLDKKWYGRIEFCFKELTGEEYNAFKTDIIVPE